MNTTSALTLHFAPVVPWTWIALLALAAVLLAVLAAWRFRHALGWRLGCIAAFVLVLLNPSLLEEKREPVSDVAVIVADRSPSQSNGARTKRTDDALAGLQKSLAAQKGLEVRVVQAPDGGGGPARETKLFEALDRALSDVPHKRRAGVIFLTDGQVHDVPDAKLHGGDYGPVHVFLTGSKREKDRQIAILETPSYGIVGENVTVRFRINDTSAAPGDSATLIVRRENGGNELKHVAVNEDISETFAITHGGQNIFELETGPLEGEITPANNRAALIVNGVRDRLRVLLVSGQPYPGGRTWRNILTSDPGVDLVHFTILREPDKMDATPQNELSLIAFPFRELFETKLYDFDLIIFDRYRLNRILPPNYFVNIAKYVREGGALLEASGPSYATEDSVYSTALHTILPGAPTGEVLSQPYWPELTKTGNIHPVTQTLTGHEDAANGHPAWGRWLRQVVVNPGEGEVLMTGAQNQPLLLLNRVGEGRVAQLASDQIWLWSRGFEGGGPQAELLRRLAHWLMKEPELDENALDVKVQGEQIVVRKRNIGGGPVPLAATLPDGTRRNITLEPEDVQWLETTVAASQLGVYSFDDGQQKRYAIVGDLNPPELREVVATPEKLAPMVKASRGGSFWLESTPHPDIRFISGGGSFAGSGWAGLRMNNDYNVTGVSDKPFFPPWAALLLLVFICTAVWWREGRSA